MSTKAEPTQSERELEDIREVSLSEQDRHIIIFALGGMVMTAFRDKDGKPNPLSLEALRVAKKFGVQ